jgi:uncharacterized protein
VAAVTAESPVHPRREIREAVEMARLLGVRHQVIASREMQLPEFVANPPERCYVCKNHVLAEVFRVAVEMGIRTSLTASISMIWAIIARAQSRHGNGCLPAARCRLGKADIRRLSRNMKLRTWNKPSWPARFPHSLRNPDNLRRSRWWMRRRTSSGIGVQDLLVRYHGWVARIEPDPRG